VTLNEVITVWGTAQAQSLVRRWEVGFRKSHPGMHVESRLTGSDVGMAGLYTGFADLAVLGRECTAFESKAFEWIFRYPPAQIQIMTGSLGHAERSPALIAFVHKDNPLAQLTLVQLDAIFGPERLGGARNSIRTWGDLGLPGEWADKSINLYTHDAESGTGQFFRRVVLKDSAKMNWERLTEFKEPHAGRRILEALAADKAGLAVAGASNESVPSVKALALARDPREEAVAASRESLISCSYPLTRALYAYFKRPPNTSLAAGLNEFLRYIVSQEGQRDVVEDTDYLPLSPQTARQQLKKLE
jgi:phosphate transport system substrate-binding protein